jgi:hypothetical protein
MRKNTKRGITAVALLGAVLATSTGCSRAAPSADVITLIYDKGPFSKTAFQECVEPNHTAWAGPFDQTFSYTAGQITYDFTGAKDAESAPLKFVSQDNQEMEVTGVAAFDLNTDCKTLQNFHENIGRRKNMYNDGDKVGEGWVPGLQTYTGQPLQRALQDAGQKYGWEALRGDGATRAQFEKDVADALPGLVAGATADDAFFVNFRVTINKPVPTNQALIDQVNEKAAAEARIATINAQKAAQDAEIAQIEQLVGVLGPDGYILYRSQIACEQQKPGCLPYLPLPTGSPVTVPLPAK